MFCRELFFFPVLFKPKLLLLAIETQFRGKSSVPSYIKFQSASQGKLNENHLTENGTKKKVKATFESRLLQTALADRKQKKEQNSSDAGHISMISGN